MENVRQMITSLIGTIALIDLIALIFQGEHRFTKFRGSNKKWLKEIVLGVMGGLFGLYATISGIPMDNGAVITVRDVGPMMAGCLGGPIGGLIAGVIAGVYRLLYGLPDLMVGSTIPCAISTLLIGVVCGFIFKSFENKKQRGLRAILIAMLMEILHLFIVFIFVWIRDDVATSAHLIGQIIAPFLIANGLAFGLLVYLIDMIQKYINVERHEKQIESELNVATSIQSDMLPSILPSFPGKKEFSIDAAMTPAKEIGGDFYDFFFIDDDHFAFSVADVSGKGVPAALFMVISKIIIKNNVMSGLPLDEAMQKVNQQLYDGNNSGMFVTVWIGVYEISTGKLTYVNAGHNPPLIKRGDNKFEYLRNLSGFILAGRKNIKYKKFETYLSDGDRLFLYTDGITEAMNAENEQYGENRLIECFSGKNKNESVAGIIKIVEKDTKLFVKDAEQSDDMTMVALMVTGEYKTMKVKATLEQFDTLSAFLTETLSKASVPSGEIGKMNMVLDELFSNVVKYSGSEDLEFGVSVYPKHIAMKMQYSGELYDIT
ncbi:MAG: SpoIIE family protein phosphatase, partial [Clostridia bacterium]